MTVRSFTSLIKGAKEWAATRGPDGNDVIVLVHVTTGLKLRGTDRLLRLVGAKCVGGGYVV